MHHRFEQIYFKPITILCGENGSEKTTALSVAHMVRNLVSPGGDGMVKVRLQGTNKYLPD